MDEVSANAAFFAGLVTGLGIAFVIVLVVIAVARLRMGGSRWDLPPREPKPLPPKPNVRPPGQGRRPDGPAPTRRVRSDNL